MSACGSANATSMQENTVKPENLRAPGYQGDSCRCTSTTVGMLITILIHVLGLWYAIHRPPLPKMAAPADSGAMTIYIRPLAANRPAQAKPAAGNRTLPARRKPPQAITTAPVTVAEAPAVKAAEAAPPPVEDMSAGIDAARRRRAEAAARDQADGTPPESEAQRGDRAARANLASLQKNTSGSGRDNSGGVFQIKNIGFHHAEFAFRGWSKNSGRNAVQLVQVEQGLEEDMPIAIVNKMIQMIRARKQDDFTWDSHRLGREVRLSARMEHTFELQQFLMREFFPEHAPLVLR